MLYIKAGHVIAMVAWFAGLFYLPRLFVYHADAIDAVSLLRFKQMESRLYYGITYPAGVATTILGVWLIRALPGYYLHAGWMHAKLTLVIGLWSYHWACGHYLKQFSEGKNKRSARFYRLFNEGPTLLLVGIVVLVIVKPF